MRPFQKMNRVINEDCESRNNHRYAVVVKDLDTTRARTKLLSCLVSTLSSAVAQNLVAQFDEALAERELLWRNVLSGTEDAMRDQPTPPHGTPVASPLTMVTVTTSQPLARKRIKIQASSPPVLTRAFRTDYSRCIREAHTRLVELCAIEVDHTWLWRLNQHNGPALETEEYVDSVRLRLGCSGPSEPVHVCCVVFFTRFQSGREIINVHVEAALT